MKKILSLVLFLLFGLLALFCWSATFTGVKSFLSWSAAGLQPRIGMSSIILTAVIALVFTALAVVLFRVYKNRKGGNK